MYLFDSLCICLLPITESKTVGMEKGKYDDTGRWRVVFDCQAANAYSLKG